MKELFAGEGSPFDVQRQSRPDADRSASNFYQFSEKPFEDNSDPKFLYLTPSYKEIFASILTWIKEGNGFAVITGEAGTGKTFFIHALVSHLDEKIYPVLVLNPVVEFKDLLKEVLRVLKQPIWEQTETDLFRHFTEFLDRMMPQGKTLLIILDEAQGLNDQILLGIKRFLDLRSKHIRIIFVGQPNFDERLNSIGLRRLGQEAETKQKIEPFREEESRGYIDHRLRLVGSSSEIMTPKAISMVCSYTRGISSLINHVCDNALWFGCNMNRKKIDVDIIEKVIQNLEGSRIIPNTFPALQLRRIWKSSIEFAIPFKSLSIVLFIKVRQNLQGLRIIPKTLPLLHLRWIWESPTKLAISFKKGSIDVFPKVVQNLQYPRIIPKGLPSIQLRRIWKSSIKFAMYFKRVSMGIFLRAVQHLEGPRIIPKTFLSIQPRRIWISPTQFAISFKRGLIAIFPRSRQNLQGPTIIPKVIPAIQLKQIWKSPTQLAKSFKRVLTAIFPKVIPNLERLRIIPKILPSIQLKGIWKSPTQFAISFKSGLMAVFPKAIRNIRGPNIIPKILPAAQLKRIWKSSIQFVISLKRILMAAFLKVRQNLQGLTIIPKTLPFLHPRRIWKSPTQLAKSFKRVLTAIVPKVIPNLAGLRIIPNILPSIQLRGIWKSPTHFAIFLKKISMAAFLLVCLGGLIFLFYEYIERGFMYKQVRKPLIGQELATRPSTPEPPPQQTTEEIIEKDRVPTSDEQKVTRPESSSLQRYPVLLSLRKRKQKPIEVKVDKRSNVAFFPKKKGVSPPLEKGLKTDGSEEAPKLMDVSKISKTQGLTITHVFAADKGPYGCVWQIYIEAEDPEADMDRISVQVDQVSYGRYPTEWIKIKPQHRKHLTGFIQWNTFSSKASYLPEGTQISVKISIFDLAGNKSNEVIIPFTFRSGGIRQYRLPAPFDKGNIPRIGYLMIDLC